MLKNEVATAWEVWRSGEMRTADGKPYSKSRLLFGKFHFMMVHMVADLLHFGPRATGREAEGRH